MRVNPLTLMCDQDSRNFSLQHQHKIKETRDGNKEGIKGLLIDPIPNSPNPHQKNRMAESKENY